MSKSFVSLRVLCIDHLELLYWDSRGLYTYGEIVSVDLVSPLEQVDISLTVAVAEDRFECQQDLLKACEAVVELVDMVVAAAETAYLLVDLENNALVN